MATLSGLTIRERGNPPPVSVLWHSAYHNLSSARSPRVLSTKIVDTNQYDFCSICERYATGHALRMAQRIFSMMPVHKAVGDTQGTHMFRPRRELTSDLGRLHVGDNRPRLLHGK